MRRLLFIFIAIPLILVSCVPGSSDTPADSLTVSVVNTMERLVKKSATQNAVPSATGGNPFDMGIAKYRFTLYHAATAAEVLALYSEVQTDWDAFVEANDIYVSGMMDPGSYTVNGILSGEYWIARVEAFTEYGSNGTYTKVADVASVPTLIASNKDGISVKLSEYGYTFPEGVTISDPTTWDKTGYAIDSNADVLLRIIVPEGITDGSSVSISYTLSSSSSGSTANTEGTAQYGEVELTISSVPIGNYVLSLTLMPEDGDMGLKRSGVILLKVMPGADSYGVLDLRTSGMVEPGLSIDDSLGGAEEITLSFTASEDKTSHRASLNGIPDTATVMLYIDNVKVADTDNTWTYSLIDSVLTISEKAGADPVGTHQVLLIIENGGKVQYGEAVIDAGEDTITVTEEGGV